MTRLRSRPLIVLFTTLACAGGDAPGRSADVPTLVAELHRETDAAIDAEMARRGLRWDPPAPGPTESFLRNPQRQMQVVRHYEKLAAFLGEFRPQLRTRMQEVGGRLAGEADLDDVDRRNFDMYTTDAIRDRMTEWEFRQQLAEAIVYMGTDGADMVQSEAAPRTTARAPVSQPISPEARAMYPEQARRYEEAAAARERQIQQNRRTAENQRRDLDRRMQDQAVTTRRNTIDHYQAQIDALVAERMAGVTATPQP